jgi:hypothetical protein
MEKADLRIEKLKLLDSKQSSLEIFDEELHPDKVDLRNLCSE